jgi:hypothetical protein
MDRCLDNASIGRHRVRPENFAKVIYHLNRLTRLDSGASLPQSFGDLDASNRYGKRNGEIHMRMDQATVIRTAEPVARVHAFDHHFDLLRERAFERSVWAVRMERIRRVALNAIAILVGCVAGWTLVK